MQEKAALLDIPLTRIKILIAKVIFNIIRLLRLPLVSITKRNNITYDLELSEGLDLSVFIFGNYQKHIYSNLLADETEIGDIIDVGANIGVMSLNFAKRYDRSTIHAFEPTHFAFKKLIKNINLNSELKKRIRINNLFLSSSSAINPNLTAYASWPVDESNNRTHKVHGGVAKPTEGVRSTTLDTYCDEFKVRKVSLIKLDTDGHEYEILKGATNIITRDRPLILFEVGRYLLPERGLTFLDYISFFNSHNYSIYSLKGERVTTENWTKYVPQNYTADLVAKYLK